MNKKKARTKRIPKDTKSKAYITEKTKTLISPQGASFLGSAGHFHDLPEPLGYEFCIMGRSNVGKSSFINHVLESGNIARVSKKPGKTNLANFFRINDEILWVDLPGYGYARASRTEKTRWSQLIKEYCEKRENLAGVIWLLDIRHVGMKADIDANAWFSTMGIPVFPVITKGDKLNQSMAARQIMELTRFYGFISKPVVYSTLKHVSRKRFWQSFIGWKESVIPSETD